MAKDVEIYDGATGKWGSKVPKGVDPALVSAEMHEAIAKGGKLPSDRSEEELAELEPGRAGPVATAGPEGSAATAGVGAARPAATRP